MKKILLIVVPLILIGGGVVGAAIMGMIDIPGLTPAKKKSKAAASYTEAKDEAPVVKKAEPKKPEPTEEKPPELDLDSGRKKLAKLWNELEPEFIVNVASDWKDDELAQQMRFLDPSKAAAVLSAMKPEKASKISKLLQTLNAAPKLSDGNS